MHNNDRFVVSILILVAVIFVGFCLRRIFGVGFSWGGADGLNESFDNINNVAYGIGYGCRDSGHKRESPEQICEDCIEDYREALRNLRGAQNVPLVFRRDGVFYVYIFKDSPYHREFGYYGKRSYGTDRARALEMFTENFPGVPVPDVLLYDGDRDRSARSCPFIMHDGNPCASRACSAVDWSQEDIGKQKLTGACKWNINQYCHRNAGRDPVCACWDVKGDYYNTRYCRDFRRKFQENGGQSVPGCQVDIFNIEEHPDMKNYIRKDSIPCFDCALDAPAGRVPPGRRWEDTPRAREIITMIDNKIAYQ